MRAVDIKNDIGPASALFINENAEKPELSADADVLVKVKAFGLNRMDLLQREGKYPLPPGASKILGVEFSGTIEQLSSQTSHDNFRIGDEVFGLAYGGAYAEYIAVSSKMLIRKPEEISYEEAAGIPEAWITAIQALYVVGGFKKGESVLVHAAASGVAIAIIQLIRFHSPESVVFATASSNEKLEFVTGKLGATYGLNYRTQDFGAEIQHITKGKGVDLIIDFPGQSHFKRNLNAAAKDGRIVMLAMLSGSVIKDDDGVDLAPILFKRLRIEGTTLRSRDLDYQKVLRDRFVEEALDGIKDGKLKIYVERILSWENIVEAHELMESNKTQGKIICTVD